MARFQCNSQKYIFKITVQYIKKSIGMVDLICGHIWSYVTNGHKENGIYIINKEGAELNERSRESPNGWLKYCNMTHFYE